MIYTYECEKCEHQTDLDRKVDQRHDPVECEQCGNPMQLIVNFQGLHVLKGSGWARDGYTTKKGHKK